MNALIPTRQNVHPFWIGVFSLVGFSLLAFFILWLGAVRWFQEQQIYVTYFDTSVEGLEPGSQVKYQGVPIGRVKSVHLAPDGRLIEVIMEIESSMQVDSNLRAKQALTSIAGGKFIQLFYPENPEQFPPLPLSFKPAYPVIPSAPSDIETLETALNEVINNLRLIDTKGISEGTIQFLNSIASFVDNPDLRTAIAHTASITQSLDSLIEQIKQIDAVHTVEFSLQKFAATADEFERTINSLQQQITQLQLDTRFQKAFERYDSVMTHIDQTAKITHRHMPQLLMKLSSTLTALEKTNQQLQHTLRTLQEDFGPLLLTEPPEE